MSTRIVPTALVLATALSGAVAAAELTPGTAAPPLALTDATGVERDLAATDHPVAIVFYRGLW